MDNQPNRRVLGIGDLGRRLVVAFVGVALAAVAAEVAIASTSADADVSKFVTEQESDLTSAVAAATEIAYSGHLRWDSAQLMPVIDLVDRTNAAVQVRDPAGQVIRSSPGFARFPAEPQMSAPLIVRGNIVGSVAVKFGPAGLGAAAAQFDAERWRARLYAAAIAVLLALVVSVAMARRISAPLERVLAAMRARGAGDRRVRVKDVREVGVLGELLEGFNAATDALDRQDQAQRNLVADVAHELRTPVAVLQAGHEAMLDGITKPTPENLGSLRDEVLRLGRMIEGLQALAAAEAAALQLRLVPQDLAAVAGDAAARLSELFETAGIQLRNELIETSVICDYSRIREVVTNLLTNALKYTPAGGTVLLEAGPYDRKLARLRVSDTGIGIPPDELPHVTERFFRGQRSAEMAGGTGIGLTIVAELVRAHHGDMKITSQPGIGTQVIITIPK